MYLTKHYVRHFGLRAVEYRATLVGALPNFQKNF